MDPEANMREMEFACSHVLEGINNVDLEVEKEEKDSLDARSEDACDSIAESIDEAIQNMVAEMSQENSLLESDNSTEEESYRNNLVQAAIRNRGTARSSDLYSRIFLGFEDLLTEGDGTTEEERKTVDDMNCRKEENKETMQQQNMRKSELERRLQSRINWQELQHGRFLDMLRESEAALTTERERRKDSRREVDRILKILKKERKSHQETMEKLRTCVQSLMKLRENLAVKKLRPGKNGGPSYLHAVQTVLEEVDTELHVNLTQWTRKSSEANNGFSDIDELCRWKDQRDFIEEERDKVEENMSLLLTNTREKHEEIEMFWLERETFLEQKVSCLEFEIHHSQMEQRRKDAEILAERVRWAEELQVHKRAWAHERTELKENCLFFARGENGCSIEDSSTLSDYDFKEGEAEGIQEVATKGISLSQNDSTVDEKITQFCVDIGNLALGIEAGLEHVTEDFGSRESQWEVERMEWKELEEGFKNEREELEKKITDTTMIIEGLKKEIITKEIEMETERKRTQAVLMQKATEVEKLNLQLKSKEHDVEVTVQKFMDEVRLIDKEVEKERKEREQVMELHFASKRKIVKDMKEREEKWDRDIETVKQELENARMEIRLKEKEIDELKSSIPSAPFDLECELTMARSGLRHQKDALVAESSKEKGEVGRVMENMLVDVSKVSQDEQIEAVMAKDINAGLCWRPILEILWLEYCRIKTISNDCRSLEWYTSVGQITKLEKEILEENTVMKTLRDELKMKDEQLVDAKAYEQVKLEENDTDWIEEREQLVRLAENQQEQDRELMKKWQVREEEFIREKEAMQKAFKVEQSRSAEAISNLRGAVRELQWVLKQSKFSQVNYEYEASFIRDIIQPTANNTDFVKVHASYLEEVDRYILELEAKIDTAGKHLISPEKACDRKCGDPELNLAFMDTPRGYFPPHDGRDWDTSGTGSRHTRKWMSSKSAPRTLGRNMSLTLNGLATLTHDMWAEREESLSLRQLDDQNSFNSTTWMSPRTSTDYLYSSHELPAHGVLGLPSSAPQTRFSRKQKWVVDGSWLHQVRKEHTWLRHQLEIERQRVAALLGVEAESR